MALEDEYMFRSNELPKRSFSFFGNKRTEFCDITFKIEERSISAHRIILAAAIPYFYKLFSDEQKENEMSFPDVDPSALESLIDYAYNCDVKISAENVKLLLTGACKLQVDEVKNACCKFLVDRISPENVLHLRSYSSSLNCLELTEAIDCYIREKFIEITMTEDFLNLPFCLLNQYIGSDELNVQNEEMVFEIALKWVKKCPTERKEHLPEVLKNIRMPFLEAHYIKNYMMKEELIRSSLPCRDLVDEALFYHWEPKERTEKHSFSTKQRSYLVSNRKESAKENLNICILCLQEKCAVKSFNVVTNKWETRMSCSFSLHHDFRMVAFLNTKIYCFLPDLTYICDLEKNSFTLGEKMNRPREAAGTAAHNNKVYVCGGILGFKPTKTVQCFDPETGKWTVSNRMNSCRSVPGVTAYANFIYVLGGINETGIVLRSSEKYNIETNSWSKATPMLSSRCSFGCSTLNDKIFVCGGMNSYERAMTTAEMFDPITDEWKFISPMTAARNSCKLVSCHDNLYVLGGSDGCSYMVSVEIYDPEADKWKPGIPINDTTITLGATVLSVPEFSTAE